MELCVTNHWFENCLLSKCFTKLKKTAESFYSQVFGFLSMPSYWFVYIWLWMFSSDFHLSPLCRANIWLENVFSAVHFVTAGSNVWTHGLFSANAFPHFIFRNLFFQDWSSITHSYNLTTIAYLSHSRSSSVHIHPTCSPEVQEAMWPWISEVWPTVFVLMYCLMQLHNFYVAALSNPPSYIGVGTILLENGISHHYIRA